MKQFPIDKQIIDIYYQFINQTSSNLLFEQTQNIFQNNLYETYYVGAVVFSLVLSMTTI